MKITILTLFPGMIEQFMNMSILKRAQEKGAVEISYIDFREFTEDKHKTVDERPYGGGAGMVLMVEPIVKALNSITNASSAVDTGSVKKVVASARGVPYNQSKAQDFAKLDHLILLAGHYEGFDERITDYIDEEVSLGDFVMTGGEIAAAAVIDSVVRLLPGVLKKEEATQQESFFKVSLDELKKIVGETSEIRNLINAGKTHIQLLEYPHYTRPEEYGGKKVPEILLSGNHGEIDKWRIRKAWEETLKRRPDLLDK